jgi:hypothetical protein
MIRQFSFVIGAILAGTWSDEGRILIKCIMIEAAQAFLGVLLFAGLFFWNSQPPEILLDVWSSVRFGLGGAGFVAGFKLFGQASQALGKGAIVHLVSTQGAALFGAVVSVVIAKFFAIPFVGALVLDISTTIILCIVLLRLLHSPYDTVSTSNRASVRKRVRIAVMGMWENGSILWAAVQIAMLVSVAGTTVFCLYIGRLPHGISEQTVYSSIVFVYGLSLWFFGALAHRYPNSKALAICGAASLVASGVLLVGTTSPGVFGIICAGTSALLYALGFPLMLHLTNSLILTKVPTAHAAGVRSSMLLYLSVILGAGEQIGGMLLSDRSGVLALGSVRTLFAGVVLAAFITWRPTKFTIIPMGAKIR